MCYSREEKYGIQIRCYHPISSLELMEMAIKDRIEKTGKKPAAIAPASDAN